MSEQFDFQSESIINKIKHYLITTMGKNSDQATDQEFYRAFCLALREEIMINWTATANTIKKNKAKTLYYLSMEYMPGRLLSNNLANISATATIEKVLKKMHRDFKKISNIEPDIGIGNGGLGRLASCFLDSLATLEYPAFGYGMRYQYGIFEQDLWCGVQIERPDCWLLTENPWEFRRDPLAVNVDFSGKTIKNKNSKGEEIYSVIDQEIVRALPYDLPIIGYSKTPKFSVLTLRLWSTKESPHNFQLQRYNAGQLDQAAENTSLTDVLYPNDNNEAGKRIRLKQEFLLVSASLQDIIHQHLEKNGSLVDFENQVRIQINDTHPALVVAELLRMLVKNNNNSIDEAWEITKSCCNYTNHTVLKEALEEWNENRIQNLLPRQYHIIQQINQRLCNQIRSTHPKDEEKVRKMSIIEGGQIKMAHLAIYGSSYVNGVAELHSNILKNSLFKDFHEMFPDKFQNVTNGVTQRRWLLSCNPLLSEFITQRIGDGWIKNFSEIKNLSKFANDPQSLEELLKIKKANKKEFLEHLYSFSTIPGCHPNGSCSFLDINSLFDVQIKRFHEYKRQLMNALHALMIYHEIKDNQSARKINRMIFFAGKAAPGYKEAKDIIRFIYILSRKIFNDPIVRNHLRIVFIPNYNVTNAEKIIPAADLSQQISTAGMEASGTGNMKLAMNGALTIGTEDGANVEMREEIGDSWWPFSFGQSAQQNQKLKESNGYSADGILDRNPKIMKAMEALRDRSLVENEAEHETLCSIYKCLIEGVNHQSPDRYLVLNDLCSYYETQKKVEELFITPIKWAEFVIHNIAGMGKFSADVSIKNYAEKIWKLQPLSISDEDLELIRSEYSQLDRCRILPR